MSAPDTGKSSSITDHPFKPRDEWWSLCGHVVKPLETTPSVRYCNLAESAHAATTLRPEDRGQVAPPVTASFHSGPEMPPPRDDIGHAWDEAV